MSATVRFLLFFIFVIGAREGCAGSMVLRSDHDVVIELYIKQYYDGTFKLDKGKPVEFPLMESEQVQHWEIYDATNGFHICFVDVPYDLDNELDISLDRCRLKEKG